MQRKLLITALSLMPSLALADSFGAPATQPAQEAIVIAPDFPLPPLKLVIDCGDCAVDAKIQALVEGAYLDGADQAKAEISDTLEAAVLTVKSYRTRGKARYFIGALAGADYLKGTLACGGQEIEIGDTAISAINGIESVAHHVGETAFRKLVECKTNLAKTQSEPPKDVQ